MKHLDLEQQQELDNYKALWQRYRTAILSILALIGVIASVWYGYQYWKSIQNMKAAQAYAVFEKALQLQDEVKIENALQNIQTQSKTVLYAQQASLLASKFFHDKNQQDKAERALKHVINHSDDEGYQAIARLRLASIEADQKKYGQALGTLNVKFIDTYDSQNFELRGDIYSLQSQKKEALDAYLQAYKLFNSQTNQEDAARKGLLTAKITNLGGNIESPKPNQ